MPITAQRFTVPQAALPADNNIRFQYPIHQGKWVRHPDVRADAPSYCRYTLDFTLDAPATIDLHVSADNRFELLCDDSYIGMGPDRSDLEHYSFHSYRLSLEPGPHRLAADVHYLGLEGSVRPCAQTCIEPAFVLYAQNSPVDLNTGTASWQVTRLGGVSVAVEPLKAYFVVGPNYTIDAKTHFAPPPPVPAVVLRDAGRNTDAGVMLEGWKLFPSRMPEQTRTPLNVGRIRVVTDVADNTPFPAAETRTDSAKFAAWQALVEGRSPITIPAGRRVTVLWDLDDYYCAYPELTTTGGTGARVEIKWAEAMFVNPDHAEGPARREKGHRDEVTGKYFRGYGDTFLPDGPSRTFRPYWWRAGRYVRIVVETTDAPITLSSLRLLETRMPLENESVFTSNDADLQPIIKVSERGIQMCAHETYMDCPYYEQMMYVGDTRLQFLTSYIMNAEDRLNQRSLEIFDWSRHETGFVLERCPSQPKQLSCTFSMVWLLMLRDYAFWRNDVPFLRARIRGMRCMLEEFKNLPDTHAPLLPALPGWSFMDWAKGLSSVNHPGPNASVSCVINLLFLNALNAAAEVEALLGEPHLAEYNRAWARRVADAVRKQFWDESRGLFAENPDHTQFSEHAQCLAILSGHFADLEPRCFESLITASDLVPTTVYFSFYLLETFARFRRGDLIQEKLEFWKQMTARGLKTPVEMPEPTRSDCHAWASHPLFHLHASIAGIRPDAPGFARVRIAPSPGTLDSVSSTIPHPLGKITVSMHRSGDVWKTQVSLPAGVEGVFDWAGKSHALAGSTELTLPA